MSGTTSSVPLSTNGDHGGTVAVASVANLSSNESTLLLYDDSDDSRSSSSAKQTNKPVIKLYPQRWIVLIIFSMLALLNNVVCYSYAPIAQLAHRFYGPEVKLGQLVSSFFLTYVIFSFPSSWFIERYGLRAGTVLGAWLQFAGAAIRCLGGQWLPAFECVIVGQVIASLGQAFFVNPPPLVAAAWFGEEERTMATTIGCNANTLGIAVVYTLAPLLVDDIEDIPLYLTIIACTSLVCAILATCFFSSEPPTPPSRSQHSKKHNKPRPRTPRLGYGSPRRTKESPLSFLSDTARQTWSLFHNSGFIHTVIAFSIAECTINTFSAFLVPLLRPLGFDKSLVGYLGTAFILACMFGSAIIGAWVDRTKKYTQALIGCMVGVVIALAAFTYLLSATVPVAIDVGTHVAAAHTAHAGMDTALAAATTGMAAVAPVAPTVAADAAAATGIHHHGGAGLPSHEPRNLTRHHHHVPPPEHALNPWPIAICLLLVGFMIGPVQPIAIEAAAEVTYPAAESSAVAVQQVLGNLISAAFFPIMMTLKDPATGSMENGVWAMWILEIVVVCFYCTFDGQFKRMQAEASHDDGGGRMHDGHSHGFGHGHVPGEDTDGGGSGGDAREHHPLISVASSSSSAHGDGGEGGAAVTRYGASS